MLNARSKDKPAGEIRCRYCDLVIIGYSIGHATMWSTPIGEPSPAGVTLGNECPARHLYGTTFDMHVPNT